MRKAFILILIVSVAVVIAASPESESATISLNPTDDAVVWNWWPSGTIDQEYLGVQANARHDDPGNFNIARAFLKFDLGDIPDSSQVINAEVRLYAMLSKGGIVDFWHGANDNWTESLDSRITWNNQPGVDGHLANLEVLDTLSSLKYINITETWDPTVDLIDDYLSIAITMVDESPDDLMQAEFISKDFLSYPYFRPLLTIEFEEITPAPLPATVWLFGAGVIGIIGYRRRSKVNG